MSLRDEFDKEMLKVFDDDETELKELIRVGRKFSFNNCNILEVTNALERNLEETRIERNNFISRRQDDRKGEVTDEDPEDAEWLEYNRRNNQGVSSGRIDGDRRENVAGEDNDGKPNRVDAGMEIPNKSGNIFIGDGGLIPDGEDVLF
jgi:hypothetical protein